MGIRTRIIIGVLAGAYLISVYKEGWQRKNLRYLADQLGNRNHMVEQVELEQIKNILYAETYATVEPERILITYPLGKSKNQKINYYFDWETKFVQEEAVQADSLGEKRGLVEIIYNQEALIEDATLHRNVTPMSYSTITKREIKHETLGEKIARVWKTIIY